MKRELPLAARDRCQRSVRQLQLPQGESRPWVLYSGGQRRAMNGPGACRWHRAGTCPRVGWLGKGGLRKDAFGTSGLDPRADWLNALSLGSAAWRRERGSTRAASCGLRWMLWFTEPVAGGGGMHVVLGGGFLWHGEIFRHYLELDPCTVGESCRSVPCARSTNPYSVIICKPRASIMSCNDKSVYLSKLATATPQWPKVVVRSSVMKVS